MGEDVSHRLTKAQLEALRESVQPDELRGTAAMVPGSSAALLGAVADALEQQDDEAALDALEAISDQAAADGTRPEDILAGVEAQLGTFDGDLELARRQVGDVASRLTSLRKAQDQLAAGAAELAEADEDPEVDEAEAALIQEAMAALGDEQLTAPLAGVLGRVDDTVQALQELMRDLPRDRGAVAKASRKWQKRLAQLEADAAALDPTAMARSLLPLVTRFAALAREQNHPGLAEIVLFEAALHELDAVNEPSYTPQTTDGIWRSVLDTAEEQAAVGPAVDAARRLQAAALDKGDLAAVGDLAARVADVAAAADDSRAWCMACLEQASVLSHIGRHEDAARVLDDVQATSERFVPELLPRVLLTRGQALTEQPDPEGAAAAFRAVIELAEHREGADRELGYALLGLCQVSSEETPDGRVLEALTFARDIGLALSDAKLHGRAAVNLAAYHLERDDRPETIGALIEGRSRTVAMAGEAAGHAFDVAAQELEETWGPEELRAQIEAFMEAARG